MKERKPIIGFWNWLLLFLAIAFLFMQHYYIALFLVIAFVAIIIYRKMHPDKIRRSSLSLWKKIIIAIAVVMATILFAIVSVPDKSDNRPGTSSTTSVSAKNRKKEKEMLRILNMWSATNNSYGRVTISKKNVPTLTLNDRTASSSEDQLSKIAIQFSNKVRAQRSSNKIKVGNPVVVAKDGTKIAVWNGSTLELTHNLTRPAKNQHKKDELVDSQKSMSKDLSDNKTLKTFINKIAYQGDGKAEVIVSDRFTSLNKSEKTAIAQKVNTLVTSNAEDFKINADPYSFLTFTLNGSLVGHSKQFSHDSYKWQK